MPLFLFQQKYKTIIKCITNLLLIQKNYRNLNVEDLNSKVINWQQHVRVKSHKPINNNKKVGHKMQPSISWQIDNGCRGSETGLIYYNINILGEIATVCKEAAAMSLAKSKKFTRWKYINPSQEVHCDKTGPLNRMYIHISAKHQLRHKYLMVGRLDWS